ncbi:MAG: hypothetical protein NT090_18950 [Acidobacteria bacterium]|nr:hypothetical protein [Acidobacteriota bacterium]
MFLWIEGLFDLLGKYEEDRQTYPALESFMPEVVNYFNEVAGPG